PGAPRRRDPRVGRGFLRGDRPCRHPAVWAQRRSSPIRRRSSGVKRRSSLSRPRPPDCRAGLKQKTRKNRPAVRRAGWILPRFLLASVVNLGGENAARSMTPAGPDRDLAAVSSRTSGRGSVLLAGAYDDAAVAVGGSAEVGLDDLLAAEARHDAGDEALVHLAHQPGGDLGQLVEGAVAQPHGRAFDCRLVADRRESLLDARQRPLGGRAAGGGVCLTQPLT